MEYHAELADRVWRIVSPHIDIDMHEIIAYELHKTYYNHGVTDWTGSELQEVINSIDNEDLELFEEDIEDDDDDTLYSLTANGKATVKLLVQVATHANCSICDVLKCAQENDCKSSSDLDSFMLDAYADDNHPLLSYADTHEPTEFPIYTDDTEPGESLIHDTIFLCTCTFGSMFSEGGVFEGDSFQNFVTERP